MKPVECRCGSNSWYPDTECSKCGMFSREPWEQLERTRLKLSRALVRMSEGREPDEEDEKAMKDARFILDWHRGNRDEESARE